MTVRVRVTAVAVLVTAVALAIGGWGLLRSVESTQLGEIAAATEDQVDAVAARLNAGVPAAQVQVLGSATGVVQVLDNATGDVLRAEPRGADVPIVSVITERPGIGVDHPVVGAVYPAGIEGGTRVDALPPGAFDSVTGSPFELRYEQVATPAGPVTVVAASPIDEVRRSLDSVRRALTVGLPLVVVLVGAVAWFVTGRALRPVEAMRAEAEAITHSTLHRRVPAPATADEVGRLARTLNAMLDRLEGAAGRQRRFVADASHELRTPVTTLRTELEVALRAGDEATLRAAVTGALAEESRLEEMLGDLLLLASVEEAPATAHTEVDLAAVAAVVAERSRPVPVTVRGRGTARGSRAQLERVVTNLVDNAARHATAAVSVTVDGSRIEVDDDGPGVAEPDRDRVFERFTRLDEGRARDAGGAGLGLAIVAAVVSAHGGEVTVDGSPTLGGARFTVELPPP
ncbi:MAG: ATP-binding protein [Acidimicrobiales bacterium]